MIDVDSFPGHTSWSASRNIVSAGDLYLEVCAYSFLFVQFFLALSFRLRRCGTISRSGMVSVSMGKVVRLTWRCALPEHCCGHYLSARSIQLSGHDVVSAGDLQMKV
jgi:hypothetical protein